MPRLVTHRLAGGPLDHDELVLHRSVTAVAVVERESHAASMRYATSAYANRVVNGSFMRISSRFGDASLAVKCPRSTVDPH